MAHVKWLHAIIALTQPFAGYQDAVAYRYRSSGGASWTTAELDAPAHPHAWQGWRWTWDAVPGVYELMCRATDAGGAVQSVEQAWTARGMGNNMVQRKAGHGSERVDRRTWFGCSTTDYLLSAVIS